MSKARVPFKTDTRGQVLWVAANVGIALGYEEWEGVLGWDEFRQTVVVRSPPPFLPEDARIERLSDEWTDVDTTRLVDFLGRMHGVHVSANVVDAAVVQAAHRNPFHPVREWFDSLQWDGENRLTKLFSRYFGAEDTPYHRGIARCWMVSACARTYQPGCQCDYLVVLQGDQGVGKTSALRALVGREWFSETSLDLSSKDAILGLRGKLCVCFDELDGLKGKASIERMKNFLTRTTDDVRLPWGRRTGQLPRRVVFAATTNEETPLTDGTGNRRFWPVRCGKVDVQGLTEAKDQLWAEAVYLYKRGQKWHPGADLSRLCGEMQAEATQRHPLEERVEDWLQLRRKTIAARGGVTIAEILIECLQKPSGSWSHHDGVLMGAIMRRLGYLPHQVRGRDGRRERRYRREGELSLVSSVTDRDTKTSSFSLQSHSTHMTHYKKKE